MLRSGFSKRGSERVTLPGSYLKRSGSSNTGNEVELADNSNRLLHERRNAPPEREDSTLALAPKTIGDYFE